MRYTQTELIQEYTVAVTELDAARAEGAPPTILADLQQDVDYWNRRRLNGR